MRLRFVADLNPAVPGLDRSGAGVEISFLPLEAIWPDERFDPSRTIVFSGDVASYNPVAEGDVLVPKVSPTFAHGRTAVAGGLVNGCALATSEVFVVRPREPDAARFIHYRLRAHDFLSEGQASWFGVAGLKRISADFLRDTHVDEHAWAQRTAIVAFLDQELARLTRLQRKLQALVSGLEAELASWFAEASAGPTTRLRHCLHSIADGPFGSSLASKHYVDAPGVRVIRLGTIGLAELLEHEAAFVADDYARTALREHRVAAGDVVMAGLGDTGHPLGRAALVGEALDGAIHKADCYRLVVDPQVVDAEYLSWALSFGPASDVAPVLSRGTTRPRLNTVVARDLPVPALPLERQRALAAEAAGRRRRVRAATTHVRQLQQRLAAYQSALVTEAVTGRIDVAGTSERQLDERAHAALEGAA